MLAHDVVTVGASAGGVSALQRLVAGLPADFPGSVFVVLHVSPSVPTLLPEILARSGRMRVVAARDLEMIERGVIYVAVPDHHLQLEPGLVRVEPGPKENSHRPSIDVLFRSAAAAYGPRVVGVVMSGALDDGTAGLATIESAGGATVVQDPVDAQMASMPDSALRGAVVHYVLPAAEIGALLVRLARGEEPRPEKPVGESSVAPPDAWIRTGPGQGPPMAFSCPECNGTLWEVREGRLSRYRCRVGHSYTEENMLAAHSDNLERALWSALRILEERAALHLRLATVAADRHLAAIVAIHQQKAAIAEQDAAVLRDVVLSHVDRRERV
jgi:two-component system chemotaxis response regulator CheB